jgi:CRP-like cAMP-binding protein
MQEPFVSRALLKSFVPLENLIDPQLDQLLSQSEVVHYYKGQNLLRAGESTQRHIYLLHGSLTLVSELGEITELHAGDAQSRQPVAHAFPRRVTVAAGSDCSVLKVNTDLLENLLCWGQVSRCLLAEIAMDDEYADDFFWISKLMQSRLFYKVSPANIRKILRRFLEVSVFAENHVINEGDEGSCCYLIKSGVAQVFVKSEGADPVAELGPGAVFGEDALVANKPRNASVIMKTDGLLLKLEKNDFYQLLSAPPVTMVTPGNLEGFLQSGARLLDVRTEKEFELGHHGQATHLPINLVYLKSRLLDPKILYITISPTEERARTAAYLLSQQGFLAYALQSGMNSLPRELADKFTASRK